MLTKQATIAENKAGAKTKRLTKVMEELNQCVTNYYLEYELVNLMDLSFRRARKEIEA